MNCTIKLVKSQMLWDINWVEYPERKGILMRPGRVCGFEYVHVKHGLMHGRTNTLA